MNVMDWFSDFDLWVILGEIWKLILWAANKCWELLVWLYSSLVPYVGEFGAIFLIGMLFLVPSMIVFVRFVNSSQAGIEGFSHGVMGVFLKIFGVFLVTMLILFVLSSA